MRAKGNPVAGEGLIGRFRLNGVILVVGGRVGIFGLGLIIWPEGPG